MKIFNAIIDIAIYIFLLLPIIAFGIVVFSPIILLVSSILLIGVILLIPIIIFLIPYMLIVYFTKKKEIENKIKRLKELNKKIKNNTITEEEKIELKNIEKYLKENNCKIEIKI